MSETKGLLPISRRIELRSAALGARLRKSLVVITPDELDALLDSFERAGFRTNRVVPVHELLDEDDLAIIEMEANE